MMSATTQPWLGGGLPMTSKRTFLLVTLATTIVWGCTLDFFGPIREILQLRNHKKKKKDPRSIRKMKDGEPQSGGGGVGVGGGQTPGVRGGVSSTCPSCGNAYDKCKRRRLVENCGHERCFNCTIDSEGCFLCQQIVVSPMDIHNNERVDSKPASRPRMKTNGHFTTFMQSRTDNNNKKVFPSSILDADESIFETEASPPRLTTWQRKRQQRPSTVSVDSHSALAELAKIHRWPVNMVRKIMSLWSIQESSAKTRNRPDDSQSNSDLYARLGLLLGDDAGVKGTRGHNTDTAKRSNNSHGSYASISSLASSDANMPASSNTSPVSTLTGSEAEPNSGTSSTSSNKGGNGFSKNGRDQSLDSVASLMSSSTTGHSVASSSSSGGLLPVPNTFHRQDFARNSDRCPPIGKRTAFVRRSDRTCNSNVAPVSSANKGRLFALRAAQIPLKPLFFEVPQTESEPVFVGRQWLFHTAHQVLLSPEPRESNNRGVVISGCPGSGKTALILQLVDYSNFGRKKDDPLYQDMSFSEIFDSLSLSSGVSKSNSSSGNSSMSDSIYQSQMSLNRDTARQLAGHVVGYHFCQTDNGPTCLVPDFIHSLAAQLCQAPQLVAFRELLLEDGKFRELLSLPSCVCDPSESFVKGILEPLHALRRQGKIPNTTCLIVVDGLNEAEYHKPDYGDTIATFLSKHILQFPSWLKLILTVRTEFLSVTKPFPFQHISLDQVSTNEHLQRDLNGYIMSRLRYSRDIQKNITAPNTKGEGSSFTKFSGHLAQLSKGCFLFVKMVLDLIEKGHLVIKSSSYKVVPVSLTEVYLLLFNLKFTTMKSYERVKSILQVCLASLYPLSALEIYHSVNAGAVSQPMTWEEFQRRLSVLLGAQFLVERKDGSIMFAHPALREFLSRRDENEKTGKFVCDSRTGDALIAFRMSRLQAPLEKEQSLALGHHMLKAHLFKSSNLPRHCGGRDLQALWLLQSSDDLSTGLACLRNVYSPNIKVSRLLLLAGANPDCYTPQPDSFPLICVAAQCGYSEFVSLLLEFGGDPNATNEALVSPLILACQKGHLEVVQILLMGGAKLDATDNNEWCALVHAAANGHLPVVSHIVQSDWPNIEKETSKTTEERTTTFSKAAQQALVMSALNGHLQVCEYLLDLADVRVNAPDRISGHTPLSAACFAGHTKTCEILIKRGAAVSIVNCQEEPPLACAVSEGQWEIAELLLSQRASIEQRDSYGRTPLMLAAAEGHLGILELLLSKGSVVKSVDKDGLSAIGWAARKGQLQAVQCLLDHSADVNQADKNGRTSLDLAAVNGDPDVVKLLLDRGAVMEHVDHSGMRPLDRAIGSGNGPAVSCFLYKGAKLGPQTWAMAEGKTDMLLLLLTKLLDDGGQLYKKNRLKEAAHRYQYALKKFPNPSCVGEKRQAFEQLKFHLCIGLARGKRKLNEHAAAKEAADQAIEIRPTAYEGYYVRACIQRDSGSDPEAYDDIKQVLTLIPKHLEFRKVVLNTKNDLELALKRKITPLQGVDHDDRLSQTSSELVPNSLRNSFLDKSTRGLSGSTDTLDQVCGISLDSVSLTSQRGLGQHAFGVGNFRDETTGIDRSSFLAIKRGFETAM